MTVPVVTSRLPVTTRRPSIFSGPIVPVSPPELIVPALESVKTAADPSARDLKFAKFVVLVAPATMIAELESVVIVPVPPAKSSAPPAPTTLPWIDDPASVTSVEFADVILIASPLVAMIAP